MKTYLVTWRIDIDADSPEEAAAQALTIQRDIESIALCFEVEWANKDADGFDCGFDSETIDLWDRENIA